jgi:peptide-methionine (S)-S-oxide reductase
MFSFLKKTTLPDATTALKGRNAVIATEDTHFVNGYSLHEPFSANFEQVVFGLGCFWGAERVFWQKQGVYVTAVGYAAGFTPNPTYEEVCSGQTGHNEVVLVVYDPQKVSFTELVALFFESHNPTQGMRQGNDTGTQYRSGIYSNSKTQQDIALKARETYNQALKAKGFDPITTEVLAASQFYYAEGYHQQYLAKNPRGYCGIGGVGVACSL